MVTTIANPHATHRADLPLNDLPLYVQRIPQPLTQTALPAARPAAVHPAPNPTPHPTTHENHTLRVDTATFRTETPTASTRRTRFVVHRDHQQGASRAVAQYLDRYRSIAERRSAAITLRRSGRYLAHQSHHITPPAASRWNALPKYSRSHSSASLHAAARKTVATGQVRRVGVRVCRGEQFLPRIPSLDRA